MSYPKLSSKARWDLHLIFTHGPLCIGDAARHTIFADGIWWDVVA